MEERAEWIIDESLDAFGITKEEAINLIESMAEEQAEERKVVTAAIDNLVDFSVAEEYQMAEEVMDLIEEMGIDPDNGEDIDPDDMTQLMAIFSKYNDRYARVENQDAMYAMIMAAYLVAINSETYLTYMTMGDERVRPWHRAHEGFTAPKHSFPQWLVPPIEHMCRCFLVEDDAASIKGVMARKTPEIPEWFDPTFKECVGMGGRIFSDEHRYFQIDERHHERLNQIAGRIKTKYGLTNKG